MPRIYYHERMRSGSLDLTSVVFGSRAHTWLIRKVDALL